MAYEFKVENKFILDAELKAENSQLKRALKDAQESARDLEQSLRDARDEYEALQSEFERFKSGAGIQEMQERLERFERSANRSAAAYRSFLESVNLKYTGRGGFFGLTDAEEDIKQQLDKIKADIESGVLSLPDAITKVKLNFGHLFEENHSKTGSAMDPAVYEGIANALTALGSKLDTVLQKFETFGTGGGAATGAKATAENFQKIGAAAEQMMNSVGSSGEFTKQLIDHLANINQVANTVSDTLTGMSALIQQINEKSLGTNLNLTMANDSQRAISIVKQQVLDYADAIVQAQQELARLSKSDAWAQIAPRGSELSRSLGQVTASLMRFDLGSITKGLQNNFVQSAGAINKYVEQVKSYANILLPFMERIKEAGVTTFDTAKLTAPVITDEGIQKLQTEQSSAAQAINQIVSSLGQEAKAVSDTDARYAEHAKAIADAANAERQKMEASRELSDALLDELRHLREIAKAAKADTGDDWHSRMLVAAEGIHSATKSLNEYTTASKEAAQAQKEFKEGASVKTASGNDGAVETAQKLTQEIHNEQDAVRQADAEYQSHISSVDAATKAEERKIKASELLADAMRSEESATDKATEAANRHQTAVDNQNVSNDKEEQRMQRLAAAEAEYYAKQEKARADAEAKKQAQIDSEVAKHNAALDKEEAAVEAATKREIEAWDRAEKAKIASIEKAAAAAAAAEQKAADAAQRATYNDARRAVNRYYGLLTSKDTNAAKREDVVMTEAGWVSQSGKYAELAQQLNDAKTAYDLFTGAQKESMMSGEQVAAINELIATRQKDYALAVENTAAKEAEHAQRSAELAQKKQEEAEAARAAKEAKQQEAEATKAQAQAERDAAKAAKETEQKENRRSSYIKQLSSLLTKCEGAERKYAAASKLSNARDNYEGIQRTKEEVQKLLVELEKESPDLDRVAAGLRNCTTEYSKNSAALQTNNSLVGRWATNGMQQLTSRLQYSLGLAAMVYKAVGEVKKMVSTAVELDSAMNTLQIVTRASGAEMDEYGKRVSSMAKETAQATKDLIDATTVYARLGYSMDESAILSKYTAMLEGVGGIEASAAQDAVTAIIKAFGKNVNDIEDVMDKLVLVGNNFPISVSQLAEGMNNAGSMLAVAGNSFEQSIALLTAANTTIQNISKASTGLRTIAARIRKTTVEGDEELVEESKYQAMVNALTKQHVNLVDEVTGEYRSTYDIIRDIAKVWKDMSSMEQAAVVEALAGTRQQNIFASLMTQFGEAEEAMARMDESAGELQESYDIYLGSIQAHVQTLKAAFDELSRDFVDSGFAKGVVDILIKIVEAFDLLIQKFGVWKTALGTIGGLAALKNLEKLKTLIFGTELTRSGAWLFEAPTKFEKLAEAILAVNPAVLAAIASVGLLIAGLAKLDQMHSLEDATRQVKETESQLKSLNDQQEINTQKIEHLNTLKARGDFTVQQETELTILQMQNTALQAQIDLLEQRNQKERERQHDLAKERANDLLTTGIIPNGQIPATQATSLATAVKNYRDWQKAAAAHPNYKGTQAQFEAASHVLEKMLRDAPELIALLDPEEDKDLIDKFNLALQESSDIIAGIPKNIREARNELEQIQKGGNVNLLKRPVIDSKILEAAGWGDFEDGEGATVYSGTYSNEAKTVAMNFTPIIVDKDGNYVGALTPEQLQQYAEAVIAGTQEDTLGLKIGATFEGADAIEQATEEAEKVHELHELVYESDLKKIQKFHRDVRNLSNGTYAALKKYVRDGTELSKEQGQALLDFLDKFGYSYEEFTSMFTQMIAETADNGGFVDSTQKNAAELATFREELEQTNKALESYKKYMEAGEKDDAVKEAAGIYKGALEDIMSGRVDSNRMHAAAKLFFSRDFLDSINWDMKRVAQELQGNMWKYLFDPEEASDIDYGQRFAEYVKNNFSKANGVWMEGNTFYYDSLEKVAKAFNMSTAAAGMFLSALDMYGVNTLRSTEENDELIASFIRLKRELNDSKAAVEELVKEMSEEGMDDVEIHAVLDDLNNAGIINLDTTELHNTISEVLGSLEDVDETKADPQVGMKYESFVSGYNDIIDMLNDLANAYVEPTVGVNVQSAGDDSNGQNGNNKNNNNNKKNNQNIDAYTYAGGKSPGRGGGDVLVNELGPELISDNGRAFIANNGRPGFVRLSDDAIVFTADETKDILHGKHNVRAKAYAQGSVGRGSLRDRLLNGGTKARAVKTCPSCGKTVGASVTRCAYCGYFFGAITPANDPYGGAGSWICKHCGTYNTGGRTVCTACGYSINWSPSQSQYNNPWTNQDEIFYDEVISYNIPTTDGSILATKVCPACGSKNTMGAHTCYHCGYNFDTRTMPSTPTGNEVDPSKKTSLTGKTSLAGSGGGNYVGGSNYQSTSDPTKVDWVAVRINRLQRTIADLEKVASSGFKKLDTRLRYTKDQIKEIGDELKVQQQAYDRYIQEADSVGLDGSIAAKAREGTIDINEYDYDTKKKIDEYMEW